MVDKRIKKSQERVLRATAHKGIDEALTKLNISETLKKIYSGDLSKEVATMLKSTYPTKRVEISKISVMNPSSLMEIPPEDDELERIIEEANTKPTPKTKEVSQDEEAAVDSEEETKSEENDYSSMKVAELKELLKEKDLPVSGTKAELIERLQA
jgi:hypothetical protein